MLAIGRDWQWLVLLAVGGAGLAQAQKSAPQQPDLSGFFASLVSALSDAKPVEFLRAVDPAMPGYERFAANIHALATENAVSSSVVVTSQEGDASRQEVELAWRLEIKGIGESGVFVVRESTVKCKLERQRKRWRVVSLEPLSFFAPPGAEGER
jgi:hypothetical protein